MLYSVQDVETARFQALGRPWLRFSRLSIVHVPHFGTSSPLGGLFIAPRGAFMAPGPFQEEAGPFSTLFEMVHARLKRDEELLRKATAGSKIIGYQAPTACWPCAALHGMEDSSEARS